MAWLVQAAEVENPAQLAQLSPGGQLYAANCGNLDVALQLAQRRARVAASTSAGRPS